MDGCMSTQESLRLPGRLELRDVGPPDTSVSHSGHLMRLLCSVILILLSAVNRLGDQLKMCNSIALQLIRHDLSGFAVMVPQQASEKAFSRSPIPFGLKIHINDFSILIDRSPQVLLLAIDLHEDFIDVEGIAIA
jgi:hypothetical protein